MPEFCYILLRPLQAVSLLQFKLCFDNTVQFIWSTFQNLTKFCHNWRTLRKYVVIFLM